MEKKLVPKFKSITSNIYNFMNRLEKVGIIDSPYASVWNLGTCYKSFQWVTVFTCYPATYCTFRCRTYISVLYLFSCLKYKVKFLAYILSIIKYFFPGILHNVVNMLRILSLTYIPPELFQIYCMFSIISVGLYTFNWLLCSRSKQICNFSFAIEVEV